MMKIFVSIVFSFAFLIAGSWHLAFASDTGKVDAKQLFESKCSICHSIDKPKSEKMSKEEWKATVMRMKNTNGCPITDEEANTIIDYLAENYGK
jgi:mono/diheme cytochrome c family protein